MTIDINQLTLGQIREIQALNITFGNKESAQKNTLNSMLGMLVIVRTYSAGVWFGELAEKAGNEVILANARRMYRWWCAESISLSAVALHGIIEEKSKIVQAVPSVWLEAIEIIPCAEKVATQLRGAKNVAAE
jgi:hypothetical protein